MYTANSYARENDRVYLHFTMYVSAFSLENIFEIHPGNSIKIRSFSNIDIETNYPIIFTIPTFDIGAP